MADQVEIDVFQRLLRLYGVFRVITGRFLQQRKRADVALILKLGIRLGQKLRLFLCIGPCGYDCQP